MLKHNSPSSIISHFNPVVSLNVEVRTIVNEKFIFPYLESFFKPRGGLTNYEELDADHIQTEIEFLDHSKDTSYVKSYLYQYVMTDISRSPGNDGRVDFKPRYVVTFDKDLTSLMDDHGYRYGELKLGKKTVLYFVYIDLQEVIKFIKGKKHDLPLLPTTPNQNSSDRNKSREIRNKLIKDLIYEQSRNESLEQKNYLNDEFKRLEDLSYDPVKGDPGVFRINLSWNTTDDLDLSIQNKWGCVNYEQKTLEYEGIIARLDVDANADQPYIRNPQENITWKDQPKGRHSVFVDCYCNRENKSNIPFTIFVENGDNSRIFLNSVTSEGSGKKKKIFEFEFINNKLKIHETGDA
ncbi:hypothetical protein [Geitlerinema sp. P-1104]|uniref:hypothetical protein n=1 Tax=Geitlerinema sp. P-1104 TaxID=2546230 RepID=UPI00197D4E63|nr:hypothetical protein [Geitlerinema sp. P-1104]